MSIYYNYFVERKLADGWHLIPCKYEDNAVGEVCWHTGSHGSEFPDHYLLRYLSFSEYRIDAQEKYSENHEKIAQGGSRWEFLYPEYRQLDLEAMISDYNDNIHEYDGIISKNALLKLRRNSEYEPKIVSPEAFNKLPQRIQENYVYHAWDSLWSEYVYIYEIVPRVLELMKQYDLELDEVRITYYCG